MTLKRLATDFFVLIPLGRRIISDRSKRARNIGKRYSQSKRVFLAFERSITWTDLKMPLPEGFSGRKLDSVAREDQQFSF